MSEKPPGEPGPAHGMSGFPATPGLTGFPPTPTGSPSWPPAPPIALPRPSRWPTLGVFVVALIGVAVGVAAWLRPIPHTNPPTAPPAHAYTEQQITEAKSDACAAVDTAHKGVVLQSGAGTQDQVSSDPALAEAQAANARLSIIGGGWYLRDHLDPATPEPLAGAIRHLAGIMLDMGANYLAGARNADPSQSALLKDGNLAFAHALELCK
jgi:hypothetical protein